MSNDGQRRGGLTRWLERAPGPIFAAYAITAAFSTYFSMYAFRKPFAAAKFDGHFFLNSAVTLKTALVISQVIGYAMSKYVGIKICSEVPPHRRAFMLIFLILWAETALFIYAFVPDSLKVFPIFMTGLPLGMVWGLVVWYLEGRKTSEILLAGLSCSYIISSGVVKDIGRAFLDGAGARWWQHVPLVGGVVSPWLAKVSEGWMPAVVGLHFLPLFFLSVWMLNQLPRPNAADLAARSARKPMTSGDRLAFVKKFGFGIAALCFCYFFLTAYRDFRDNYQVEIFDGLGYRYADNKTVISKTELIVAFGVMTAMALLNLIRDNRRGLLGAFVIMTSGVALLGGGTALKQAGVINGFWWMTLTGLGSYLAYVPFGSVLFDRLMASTRTAGTAVFAIYVADSIGYTGSVGVQLYRDLVQSNLSRLGFFIGFTWFMSILGVICFSASCIYFLRRHCRPETADTRG